MPLDPDEGVVKDAPPARRTYATPAAATLVLVAVAMACLLWGTAHLLKQVPGTPAPRSGAVKQASDSTQPSNSSPQIALLAAESSKEGSRPDQPALSSQVVSVSSSSGATGTLGGKSSTSDRAGIVPRLPSRRMTGPASSPVQPNAETATGRAISLARALLARREYEQAVRTLQPFFSHTQAVETRDDKELLTYLTLLEESRRLAFRTTTPVPSEIDQYHHWPAMHHIAVAWHIHMKHAIAKSDIREARTAYEMADDRYASIINAVVPRTEKQMGQVWRRNLVGFAMENRAIIREQLAKYTGEQWLLDDARQRFEECMSYYEARTGKQSEGYVRSVKELKSLNSVAKEK